MALRFYSGHHWRGVGERGSQASESMSKGTVISIVLRGGALAALIFGFMAQLIADGQVFTHALFGVVYGIVAVICGSVLPRRVRADGTRRWLGWIVAGLGLLLALSCVVQLPSAHRRQTRFNDMVRKLSEMRQAKPTPNTKSDGNRQ